MSTYKSFVLNFIHTLEKNNCPEILSHFYHPEATQVEFPNSISKYTTIRGLDELREASRRGRQLISKEEYIVKNLIEDGNTVVLECLWKGTLAQPLGIHKQGDVISAHFAQIFEFKDGKIYRQRNYDCFELTPTTKQSGNDAPNSILCPFV